MKKLLFQIVLLIITLFFISCSGDDSTTVNNNDNNQSTVNDKLSINALPTSEFALFRINYQKIKDVDGVSTSFSSIIKSNNSTTTTNINLDDFYEEGATNYLVIKRMGVLMPNGINIGIWLMDPDLKFYINEDFIDYTEWYQLKIEVKKTNGVYSFTKA